MSKRKRTPRVRHATVTAYPDQRVKGGIQTHIVAVTDDDRLIERFTDMPTGDWGLIPVTRILRAKSNTQKGSSGE